MIIDEAHRLNQQLLEQIRLLSNIEKQDVKLINIFFVGQNELYELIMDEQNKALRQRISVSYNIESLTEPETEDYIKHRLRVAGTEEEIFSPDAIYEVFSFSKGCPRLINTICDRAMLTGYVMGLKKIDVKIIEAVEKLGNPMPKRYISERKLRSLVKLSNERQRGIIESIIL